MSSGSPALDLVVVARAVSSIMRPFLDTDSIKSRRAVVLQRMLVVAEAIGPWIPSRRRTSSNRGSPRSSSKIGPMISGVSE